ncbi:Elongation of fatty acids protein 2 [Rhodotorula kratochvilovae]
MGIKGLTGLINDNAPKAIRQAEMKTLFGRKVAIDASMSIYQFLIAVRQQDGQQLMNDAGETTSHLMGLFYRTIRMVENDLKPCYVFDGKPPQLKSNVLKKRFSNRQEAKEDEVEAKETGTAEDVDKLSRRQVKVTREHNEECRRLLTLMGIPWVEAPSEAEAQCAELCRGGLVYGAGSEDMDTLTFNSPIVLRHLTFSEARKMPIDIISLDSVLEGLQLSMDKFIDMCMLCGCDYLEPIKGVGAKTALKMVREYDSMEDILAHLRKGKNPPPEDWPYEEAKKLFQTPEVKPASEIDLKWEAPDVEGLVDFLVREKGFSEERVRKGADKLKARLAAKQQGRLDGFFTVAPKEGGAKRKADDKKDAKGGKKAKTDAKGKAKGGNSKKK